MARAYSGRIDYSGATERSADEMIAKLAWLMDNSIPLGGGYRIGLDPIIGLIPGLGDLLSMLISTAIVIHAHRAGIPRVTLLRMVANIGIDTLLGAVPLFGDIFDAAFKSNIRNLELYRGSRAGTHDSRGDAVFLVLLLLALGIFAAIPILVLIALVQFIAQR